MLIKIVVAFVGALAVVSAAAAAPVFGWWFTRLASLPAGLLAMHGALQSVFSPRPIPPHYERRTGALLTLTPQRFRDNAQDVVALKGFVKTLAPRLPQIIAPTAILTGDHDGVASARLHSFTSAREIPGATLTILHNVGHSPHWADPAAVVQAIVAVADRAAAQTRTALRPVHDPRVLDAERMANSPAATAPAQAKVHATRRAQVLKSASQYDRSPIGRSAPQ